jgi:hypothetical protein
MGRTSTKCRCTQLIVDALLASFRYKRNDSGEINAWDGHTVFPGNKKVLDPDGIRSIEANSAGIPHHLLRG